ncbi:MAG: hypothetical protein WC781_00305 [Candidatus Pacearchaeota archaeon]|jgi:hypothetical protein
MTKLEYNHMNEVMEFYEKRMGNLMKSFKALPCGHFSRVVKSLTPIPHKNHYEEFIEQYVLSAESLYDYFCMLEENKDFRNGEFSNALGYFPDLGFKCEDGARGYIRESKKRLEDKGDKLKNILDKINRDRK